MIESIPSKFLIFVSLNFLFAPITIAQPPAPSGMKWEKIDNMSDEFNGNRLNHNKWATFQQGWLGRPPGLFVANTIQVNEGNLKITNRKLPRPETKVIGGITKKFTHAGGLVRSKSTAKYGYFSCRMKASKTFMSSTFWLNSANVGTGCGKRSTELDIQECVGEATKDRGWIQRATRSFGSNTHSRGGTCSGASNTNTSGITDTSGKVYEKYFTYGVWWKNARELIFYLDGHAVHKIMPPANFDIEMSLRMVTETYDWNPVPANGGMTGSVNQRTTYYDWVRSFKLVPALIQGTSAPVDSVIKPKR